MPLTRKHQLLAAAAAVLMAVPAVPPPAGAAAGGPPERPPLVPSAILPEGARVRRQRRLVRVRAVRALLRRWRPVRVSEPRGHDRDRRARRTTGAAHARGPPRAAGP